MTKRSLNDFQQEVDQLIEGADSLHEVAPRRKRFANVQAMTQYPTQQTNLSEASILFNTRAGYIKCITLVNFMCHSNFSLELGPRLNFIVGNNGSGKSAVLTAITIGLGAKATVTNRGATLKDLIKQGCNYSKITIVLSNEGVNSFEPDTYGKEIRIERTLRREGTASSFSVRSENNREITSKKRDLDSILDFFSILVANPMCFLSQDAARSFLTAASAQDKYLHFMKGTLLEETKLNLEHAESTVLSSRNKLNLLEENIRILQNDYKNAQTLLNQFVSRDDWSSRRRLLQGKHMWLVLGENKRSLELLCRKKEHMVSKNENYHNRIKENEDKMNRYQIQKEEVISQVSSALSERQRAESERSNLKIEIEKFKNEHSRLKTQQQTITDELHSATKHISVTRSQLEAAEAELMNEMGGSKERMREDLLDLQRNADVMKEHLHKLQERMVNLDNLESEISTSRKHTLDRMASSLRTMKSEYQDYQNSGDRLAYAFERNMPLVMDTIKKHAQRFSKPPIGPVGYYVSVKSGYEKYAPLIQTHIGGTLGSFVVNSSRDAILLKEIFKKCHLKKMPLIITYNLRTFDYSRGKASSGLTISDVLSYDIPELEYLFVDMNKTEKTLLAENKDEGDRILRVKRPRNTKLILAFRDKHSGLNMSLSGGSGMRLNVVTYPRTLRLKLGDGKDVNYLKDAIDTQNIEFVEKRDEFASQINDVRVKKKELEIEINSQTKKLRDVTKKVDGLENRLSREVDSGRVEILRQALEEQSTEIGQLEANIASFDEKFAELGTRLSPVKDRYDSVTKKNQEAQAEYSNAVQAESNIEGKINIAKSYLDELQRKLQLNTRNLEELSPKIDSLQNKCAEQLSRAESYCTLEEARQADLPSSEEEIERAIRRIDESFRAAERKIGMTQEEVTTLYEKSKEKYDAAVNKYNQLIGSLVKLDYSLGSRRAALELSVKSTCTEADIDFRTSMKTRPGYSGSLSFREAGQLNIMVQTINDKTARNVDTLSGGEKSFSQIALLLATWLTMRSRIIALDEFDVFMDQVNRKIGTDLIIRRLGKDVKAESQTIIITPQDIGKMTNIDESYVHVHRMRDPERQNNSNFYN